jgi:hypothetical protein
VNDTIAAIIAGCIAVIFVAYAALRGIIASYAHANKVELETRKLVKEFNEFNQAREHNRCYFNEYLRKNRETA